MNFHNQYIREIGFDREFCHAYNMGIAVLLSCRQIYHEGAAILYGANEFMISRVTDRRDDDGDKDFFHWNFEYHPFNYAAPWLCSIGSQYSLLKTVVLDTDSLCPSDCEHGLKSFDILPIVRFMWAHPETVHKIRFGRSGRAMLRHIDDDTDADFSTEFESQEQDKSFQAQTRAQNLNFMLSQIVMKDSLNLKRIIFSGRILASIEVQIDAPSGWVHYLIARPSPSNPGVHDSFYSRKISQTGDGVDVGIRLLERKPIRDLTQLMEIMS